MFATKRALLRTLEKERDRNARREGELLDRIMHLANKPWNVSPADLVPGPAPEPESPWIADVDQIPHDQ